MGLVPVKAAGFTDSDGVDVFDKYSAAVCPLDSPTNGCQVATNGFEGIVNGAEQGNIWQAGVASADVNLGTIHPKAHYSQVVLASVAVGFSPGALTRGNNDLNDDYGCSPLAFGGGAEIFEHTSSGYVQLASGGVTVPIANDTLRLVSDAVDLHEVFINGASQTSVTDASHATGDPGIYCFGNDGVGGATAVGDDWEAGNLSANLKVTEFLENNWLGQRLNLRRTRVRERFNRITAGTA